MRLCRVHCSPAEGKDSVYRIWGTGGEGGLQTEHRCETDESLEIAPFELLPAGVRKALNASVPAEGRGEEDKSPHGLKPILLPPAFCCPSSVFCPPFFVLPRCRAITGRGGPPWPPSFCPRLPQRQPRIHGGCRCGRADTGVCPYGKPGPRRRRCRTITSSRRAPQVNSLVKLLM